MSHSEPGRTADAQRAADVAAEEAEQAADAAEESADAAEASAEDAALDRREVEERSAEYLKDAHPDDHHSQPFGPVGAPLKRHSPFYIGFFGAVGALVAIWLGQQIQSVSSVLIQIVVAMFLAVGLNPLVEFFMRRGLKRTWGVVVVIIGVLVAITLFIVAIAPVVSDQITTITERAPDWFRQLQNNETVQQLNQRYDIFSRIQSAIEGGNLAQRVFGGVVGVGVAVLSGLINAFIVTVLTLYFLASLPSIKRAGYRLAPASRRQRVTILGDRILSTVGGYVLGAFVVATCAGISSLVFLLLVGLSEYAVALAVVVAILDVIPMIGATLGAIVVTAIGFATDPTIGIACLIFYVLYQQFENYVIYPRVMARSVDIPGSLIVIAALIGAALLGVVGALLAIPTAAALLLLLKEVFLRRQDAR